MPDTAHATALASYSIQKLQTNNNTLIYMTDRHITKQTSCKLCVGNLHFKSPL